MASSAQQCQPASLSFLPAMASSAQQCLPASLSFLPAMASSAHHQWEHDVFVSFRGEQVRDNFLSHLFAELDRQGIEYYRDNDKRELGTSISEKLRHAIKHSRVSIILFSSNYAESRWCLNELVEILEVHEKHWDHVFVPIFYHVEAGEVREQRGTFGAVFQLEIGKLVVEYLQGINKDDLNLIPRWQKALTIAGISSGLVFHNKQGSEAKFIEDVVDNLSSNVFAKSLPCLNGKAVPIESRVEKVLSLLNADKKDGKGPHVIGLHGDTGMGKTMLAGIVFMQVRSDYEASSFVQLEKDADLVYLANLQRKLLSDIFKASTPRHHDLNSNAEEIKKKVRGRRLLLVLDNLVSKRQAEAFAVGGLESPFSSESRVIITTRDEQLLGDLHVDEQRQLKLEKLGKSDARLLFCRLAFCSDCPKEGTEDLVDRVLPLSDGFPCHLGHLADIVSKTKDAERYAAIEKWETRQFPHRYRDRIGPLEGLRDSFIFSSPSENFIPADNLPEEEELADSHTESVFGREEYASSGSPTGTATPLLSEKDEAGEVIDPLPSPIGLTDAPETSERGENSTLQSVGSDEETWKLEQQDETAHAFPFADQNGKQESITDSPRSPVIDHHTQNASDSNGHTPETYQMGNAEGLNEVMNDYSKAPITYLKDLLQIVVQVEERLLEAPKNLAEFQDFSTLSNLLWSLHASQVLPPPISLVCRRISSRLLFYNEAFAVAGMEMAHLEERLYMEKEKISTVTSAVLSQKANIKKMKDKFTHLKIQEEETEQQINQLQEKMSEIKRNMDVNSQQEGAARRDIEQLSLDLTKLKKEYGKDSRELYKFQDLLAESRGSLSELRQVVEEFLKSRF
ncbi:hypothetical protein MLD38_021536 [Melastoma candidum]|uniref:Uncharacterized protein n=1 Tax=Melastoma candidum TaxID=119954 RepID=A0ACB9QHL2_9MYRT|nr:hypothetical protein MLD38_021536 [Melastoma candidum]